MAIKLARKAAYILRVGRNKYKTSMATTRNNIRKDHGREATTVELVEEMYREWQIGGGKTSKLHNEDNDCRVKTVLTSQNAHQTKKKKCYNCGPEDHMRNKCPPLKHGNKEEKKPSKGVHKFNDFCNLCGKRGHREKDCWNKYPEKRKQKNKAAISIEQDIIVLTIEVPRWDLNQRNKKDE